MHCILTARSYKCQDVVPSRFSSATTNTCSKEFFSNITMTKITFFRLRRSVRRSLPCYPLLTQLVLNASTVDACRNQVSTFYKVFLLSVRLRSLLLEPSLSFVPFVSAASPQKGLLPFPRNLSLRSFRLCSLPVTNRVPFDTLGLLRHRPFTRRR